MKATQIETKKPGRKTSNAEALKKIVALKTGDSIVIKKKEWNTKTRPGQHMLRKQTGREFEVSTLLDETGWLVTAL